MGRAKMVNGHFFTFPESFVFKTPFFIFPRSQSRITFLFQTHDIGRLSDTDLCLITQRWSFSLIFTSYDVWIEKLHTNNLVGFR